MLRAPRPRAAGAGCGREANADKSGGQYRNGSREFVVSECVAALVPELAGVLPREVLALAQRLAAQRPLPISEADRVAGVTAALMRSTEKPAPSSA